MGEANFYYFTCLKFFDKINKKKNKNAKSCGERERKEGRQEGGSSAYRRPEEGREEARQPALREEAQEFRHRSGYPAQARFDPLRQKAVLHQRLKVPPPINQFTMTLDRPTATQVFKLLDKYRPESRQAKKQRLLAKAEKKVDGKDDAPSKRPPVVRQGLNTVTTLVEKKKAQLVVIAHDVDPIELVMHLPALCRKMGVPYCIVKGKARIGRVVRRKTCAALALSNIHPEDKSALSKVV